MNTSAPLYRESAISFDCAGETLLGVLAQPSAPQPCARTGVLIVVGGPQYRVGSHRLFVLLARRLATAGHVVLRFDVRGMGDGGGTPRSFEDLQQDIAAGMDTLLQAPGVERVALWGLCDGASASLLYMDATADTRVAGLALLNPWVRSGQSLARTHIKHYYIERLLQPAFWHKLLRGGIGLQALQELGSNALRAARRQPAAGPLSFQQRMAQGWNRFEGDMLVLSSENDWTAREFEEHLEQSPDWTSAQSRPNVRWQRLDGADHTLSDRAARLQMEDITLHWLQGIARHG